MKNTISELKNTVEGIKSRFDDAKDRISKGVPGGKKFPERPRKEKKTQKERRGVKGKTTQHEMK